MRTINLFFVFMVALLSGCAGTSGFIGGGHGLGVAGYDARGAQYGRPGYAPGGGLYAHPCEPYPAYALMDWATELDNPQHKRQAHVSNSNGRINCYSSESASSASGMQRRGSPMGYGPQQMQYRSVPRQQYQEPQIQDWR